MLTDWVMVARPGRGRTDDIGAARWQLTPHLYVQATAKVMRNISVTEQNLAAFENG